MRQWVRIAVVVILLVVSGVAAPVVAQPEVGGGNESGGPNLPAGNSSGSESESGAAPDAATPGTGNQTNQTTNSTNTNSSGDGGSGGGIGGAVGDAVSGAAGAVGGAVPSAGDWLESAIEWVQEDVSDGIAGYIEHLNAAFVGIASPGEAQEPSSWVMPDNNLWGGAASFYVGAASMSSVLLAGALVFVFDVQSREKQREVLGWIVRAVTGIVLGMPLLGLYFNAVDTISIAIAPGSYEFMNSTEGMTQLAIGHVIALVLFSINAGIVVLGGVIMFGIYILPYILYAFWPFIVAGKAVPIKHLQSTANIGITTLGLLPLLRLLQSLLLRLAKMLTWTDSGLGAQIGGLLGTAIILVIALLALPYMFYKNVETASGMALSTITVKKANRGASKANNAAATAASRVGGRAKQAAAPYADRARSAASQKASNAKQRAGSRIGGAVLTAKYGRPGRGTGASSSSTTVSSNTQDSGSSTPATQSAPSAARHNAANQSSAARRRAIRRHRRNAKKQRQADRSSGFRNRSP